MKTSSYETKRKPKRTFRVLRAKLKRKKQQVAAAAKGDFAVEEPNLGVARALIVILVLHVAAIGAIVIHSSKTKGDEVVTTPTAAKDKETVSITAPPLSAEGTEESYDWVGPGDTYERIARRNNVDVRELRRLNRNVPALQAGIPLRLPSVREARTAPAPSQQYASANRTQPVPTVGTDILPPIESFPAREVASALPDGVERVENTPVVRVPTVASFPSREEPVAEQPAEVVHRVTAVQARPTVAQVQPQPVRETIPEPAPQPVSTAQVPAPQPRVEPTPAPMKSYKVRSGDTLWAIANRNGVSTEALLKANPNVSPRSMSIGTVIKIPK